MKTKIMLSLAAICAVSTASAETFLQGSISNVRALTSDSNIRYENPQWSPDGSRVAFTTLGYDGLYVVNSDGSGKRRLTDAAGAGYRYQWSADSENILMRDTRYEQKGEMQRRVHALWSVAVDGTKIRLTDDAEELKPAAWTYGRNGEPGLIAPSVQFKPARAMQPLRAKTGAPRLSSSITPMNADAPAYAKNLVTDTETLQVVDAAGNASVIYRGCALNPVLSPNGMQVAFATEFDEITVMNIDGSAMRKLARGFSPSWVGNGQLVYERTTDDGSTYTSGELYLLTLATGLETQLTSTPGRIEMNATVSPDGKRIAFSDYTSGQLFVADIR